MQEESAGSDEGVFGRSSAGVDVPLEDNVSSHFLLSTQSLICWRDMLTVKGFTDIGRGTAGGGSDPGKEAKPETHTHTQKDTFENRTERD